MPHITERFVGKADECRGLFDGADFIGAVDRGLGLVMTPLLAGKHFECDNPLHPPYLGDAIAELGERSSEGRTIMFAQTAYWAGYGMQAATVWRNGALLYRGYLDEDICQYRDTGREFLVDLEQRPINVALMAAFAIQSDPGNDAFDKVGLKSERYPPAILDRLKQAQTRHRRKGAE